MDSRPVVVVGGGIAGLAAAARLAKAGHPVELYEREDRLGGRWRPYELPGSDPRLLIDDAPAVLTFPAPWRDLFRKSGRPLEAELARVGWRLEPAEPAVYRFADGRELALPSDRGEQFAALGHAYGRPVAERWRDLLDALDNVWQAIRPLGLEYELQARRQLPRAVRQRLLAGRSVADLAAGLAHPDLSAIVRSVAYRNGSAPERTPAMVAVALAVERTFGRWQVTPDPGSRTPPADALPGRSSVLIEALAARTELRRVTVHVGTEVTGIDQSEGRVTGVRTAAGPHPAAAVICTANPWHALQLLPPGAARTTRRRIRALTPAIGPVVEHAMTGRSSGAVTELVDLTPDGRPVVRYERPAGDRTVQTTMDFRRGRPDPGLGAAWSGFRSWLHRPAVTTELTGLFLAGAASPGGPGASAVVLSGALASYGCHDLLGR